MRRLITIGAVIAALVGVAHASRAALYEDPTAGVGVTGAKQGGVVWTDFDEDGRLDLVILSTDPTNPPVLLNGTDTAYVDITDTHAPGLLRIGTWIAAVAGDMNNDGLIDLVTLQNDDVNSVIEVYLNGGTDALPPYTLGAGSGSSFSVVRAAPEFDFSGLGLFDYNEDGLLDVLVDDTSNGFFILLNAEGDPGPGLTFLDMTGCALQVSSTGGGHLSVSDYNGDGWVDVIGRKAGAFDVYRNDGHGSFEVIESFNVDPAAGFSGAITACDIDDDDDLDLIFTQEGAATARAEIHAQQAGDVFVNTAEPIPTPIDTSGVACNDVDNDGDMDLFFGSTSNNLYINDSFGRFSLDPGFVLNNPDPESALFGDSDRDGDLDLLLTANDPMAGTQLYLNDTNDTGDDNYLVVRVRQDVGACDGPPIFRDAIGATLQLHSEAEAGSGLREISGGTGYGGQPPPWVHFGLPLGPDVSYDLSIQMPSPPYKFRQLGVIPSDLGAYQMLTIDEDRDFDDDTILNRSEAAHTSRLELPTPHDLDQDGAPNWVDEDADGDGLADIEEAGDTDPCTPPRDSDGDDIADFLDADDDNDTISTETEVTDGLIHGEDVDDDTVPNFLDLDSDADGLTDQEEGRSDLDNDGIPAYLDPIQTLVEGGGCRCAVRATRPRSAPGAWAVGFLGLAVLIVWRARKDSNLGPTA